MHIPLREIASWAIILWIAIVLITTIRICIKHAIKFREQRNYKIGMFAQGSSNCTLQHVEEDSAVDMIMGYYRRPLFYLTITDKRKLEVIILKESEHQKSSYDTEKYIREQLRNGSKIKVLTTSDKTFHVTVYYEKKYFR